MKIIKSISLIILAFLITSCSKNSAMKPEDFKNKEPRLIIEEYLTGNVKALTFPVRYSSIINLGSLFLKSSGFMALFFEQLVIKKARIINEIDLIIFILFTIIYSALKIELNQYFWI